MPTEYPKRPGFFAYRFCRLMAKVCLANEVGPNVCWLLTTIAMTEDAKGYRDSVTFFNEQLMAVTGFNSPDALDRCRKKAIESGWLHYLPGRKGIAGRYWVLIPDRFRTFDDAPSDENPGKYFRENADTNRNDSAKMRTQTDIPPYQSGDNPEESAETTRKQPGRKCGDNPEESADHSSLTLKTLPLSQEGEGAKPPTPSPVSELIDEWNGLGEPFSQARPTDSRKKHLRARLADAFWRENWKAAIAEIPNSQFLRGVNDRGWVADIDWFLRPDTVVKILEGKYANNTPARTGGFQTHDDRTAEIMFPGGS